MDITSIPLDDAIYFLESNKQRVPQTQDEIYTATWDLIMSGRAQTSPPAVADWIIAYNLQDSDIPPLKTSYILTAPDANLYDLTDIFQLGEVDKERIIRILGFLNALENDISLFDTLPDSALEVILSNLDCKSVLLICKLSPRLNEFCRSDRLSPILSAKLKTNLKGYSLEEMGQLCNRGEMLITLNKLSRVHRAHDGFGKRPSITGRAFTDINFDKLLDDAFKYGDKVVRGRTTITDKTKLRPNDQIEILYDINKLQRQSQTPISYRNIILKYEDPFYWEKLPREWYNVPPTFLTGPRLPYLNSRPYIKVDNPFMQVIISADIKNNKLTIDDILFATRALVADETRYINDGRGYRIIEDLDGTLVLEPSVDNRPYHR